MVTIIYKLPQICHDCIFYKAGCYGEPDYCKLIVKDHEFGVPGYKRHEKCPLKDNECIDITNYLN